MVRGGKDTTPGFGANQGNGELMVRSGDSTTRSVGAIKPSTSLSGPRTPSSGKRVVANVKSTTHQEREQWLKPGSSPSRFPVM